MLALYAGGSEFDPQQHIKQGLVVHSTWEEEAGAGDVQGCPKLQREFRASLGYTRANKMRLAESDLQAEEPIQCRKQKIESSKQPSVELRICL